MREEYLKAHQYTGGREKAQVWTLEGHQKVQVLGGTLLLTTTNCILLVR